MQQDYLRRSFLKWGVLKGKYKVEVIMYHLSYFSMFCFLYVLFFCRRTHTESYLKYKNITISCEPKVYFQKDLKPSKFFSCVKVYKRFELKTCHLSLVFFKHTLSLKYWFSILASIIKIMGQNKRWFFGLRGSKY